ncbi:hypothetical protein AB2M62_10485 [Sphingomonas sp. MMS12-HWE2-04]|uniref:hypothetical protein n=1 Tax=Sphingomonas sp. MMS12-HWE2-04 TaxID=3234199 RepID=UPI00384EEFB4
MDLSAEQRRQAFCAWLRTGRCPRPAERRPLEVKFNPWHDPSNGQFTYAGGGVYARPGGGAKPAGRGGRGGRQDKPTLRYAEDPKLPPITNRAEADAWRTKERAKHLGNPAELAVVDAWHQRYLDKLTPQPDVPGSAAVEFAEGFGEGVYDVGKSTVQGLYALVTTNPITTAHTIGRGVAGAIDAAIAAEDTPAYVQIDRAAGALANASAHDLGHGLGTVVGNVGLAVAPGAAVAKISAIRRVGAVGRVVTTIESPVARFGISASPDYRSTFFGAHPELKHKVVVHHAVEKQVLDRFPGVVTESEMHSLENLRGVPTDVNSKLHLSKIRTEWN